MLDRVVDAQWNQRDEAPRLGAPLEPGWLRLKSGLAQIVFYSGARVVIEGPAELQTHFSQRSFLPQRAGSRPKFRRKRVGFAFALRR